MLTFLEYASKTEISFVQRRKSGAERISNQASGSVGLLTRWHFNAKIEEYDHVKKALEDKKPKHYFKTKMLQFLREAAIATYQRKFQELMGRAEVWGEIYYNF